MLNKRHSSPQLMRGTVMPIESAGRADGEKIKRSYWCRREKWARAELYWCWPDPGSRRLREAQPRSWVTRAMPDFTPCNQFRCHGALCINCLATRAQLHAVCGCTAFAAAVGKDLQNIEDSREPGNWIGSGTLIGWFLAYIVRTKPDRRLSMPCARSEHQACTCLT